MKNLFLVDGAAGVGKSTLLAYVRGQYSGQFATGLLKYGTRPPRIGDGKGEKYQDFTFVGHDQFAKLTGEAPFYWYTYFGNRFGFKKNDLDQLLATYINVFVIVRSRELIKVLMHDYQHLRVVPVLVYTPEEVISQRVADDARTQLGGPDIKDDDPRIAELATSRLQKSKEFREDYLREPLLYAEVLLNTTAEIKTYERLIDSLIDKYNRPQLPPLTSIGT